MRVFPVALSLLVSSIALAQDVEEIEMNVNPFGGTVKFRQGAEETTAGASVKVKTTHKVETTERVEKTEELAGDGYRIVYRTSENGATMLEVVEPAGVQLVARKGNFTAHRDTVPTSFHADGNIWYQLMLKAPNGAVLEQRVQARPGMIGTVRFTRPTGAPAPVQVVMKPAAPPARTALSAGQFTKLAAAIEAEGFGEDKLGVLRTAVTDAWFTTEQVGALVDLLSFSGEKIEVVKLTRSRIVDRGNTFQLYEHFSFSQDKAKVRELLAAE